jgi:hypothetical protein
LLCELFERRRAAGELLDSRPYIPVHCGAIFVGKWAPIDMQLRVEVLPATRFSFLLPAGQSRL